MTSIIISTDDHNLEKKIGQKLARNLGYKYLGLSHVKDIAREYGVEEDNLLRALNRSSAKALSGKSLDRHLSLIQASTIERLLEDSVVCEGLASHLYVRGVSHILTIRLVSDSHARAVGLSKEKNVSLNKAQKIIQKEENRQIRWSKEAFSIDESDSSLYDMMINVGQIEQKKALSLIEELAGYRKFKSMTYSRKSIEDLALASKLRVALLPKFPNISVVGNGGTVAVHIKCSKKNKSKIAGEIKVMANEIPGIKFVEVHAVTTLPTLDDILNFRQSK